MRVVLLLLFCGLVPILKAQETEKRNYLLDKTGIININVDAKFDESDWNTARWEDDFIQFEPQEGKKPLKKTKFAFLYDENNLYVGIKSYDNPDSISMRLTRRDVVDGDMVAVMIDSYFDKRTSFNFIVSAAGVKSENIMSNDGDNEDYTWDPIWWVKTVRTDYGWNAEMRIPMTQLRFEEGENQKWGIQVLRYIFRKDELSSWQPMKRATAGFVSQYGTLTGMKHIKPKNSLNIMPYLVARSENFDKEPGNPFRENGKKSNLEAGLDAKIGLTNNFTLDLTINPDFGQVEADPSEVNLSTYETFFEEKRPFFIEGKNILSYRLMFGDGDMASEGLFYSRRIGRRPNYSPELKNGEFADIPEFTKILGAAKITGKTNKGWSAGILESVTRAENAEIRGSNSERFQMVEPFSNYFVTRVQKDFNDGNTYFGGMLTSVIRNLDDQKLNFLHKSAYSGGIDFVHKWHKKDYILDGGVFFSNVNGSRAAITRTQKSYIRNFQRPDANYLTLDTTRTSLFGHGGKFTIGKIGGKLRYLGIFSWKSPGLELNDMGYAQQVDNIFQIFWMGYRIYEPFSIFRQMNFNLNQWNMFDFGGNLAAPGGSINANAQFTNYWNAFGSINVNGTQLDKTALRGGEALKTPGDISYNLGVITNHQKKLSFEVSTRHSVSFVKDFSNSHNYSVEAGYRPIRNLRFDFMPSYATNHDRLQYVTQLKYNNNTRYIFATINRKTINLSARFNFNITPDLTIQYWGQPFVATGNYSEFKYITNSKAQKAENRFFSFTNQQMSFNSTENRYFIDENSDAKYDYNIGKPDFNVREFLSNLVLRWEYKPGSTLFFVWSQNRNGFANEGTFEFNRDFNALLDAKANNIFLVKLSYRLGR